MDGNKTLLELCKDIAKLQGGSYHQDKNLVYASSHKACANCGLTLIYKYNTTTNVRFGLKDLNQYCHEADYIKEAFGRIIKNIHHASYHIENYGK